ncbi:PREDICTED: CD109 antigen isoform X2 [Drosophila arizonae]|uniref:CD109 antigen isoform X2 n=1 Tax=Drosophila arizonae TaxID=7263 RepID=A0ABM1NTU7_DROAR|nr:PREDICTED: CD109 antigen isoform X2 [Drosophila arizonae]
MSRLLVFCLCVFQLGLLIKATGLYTIIAPGTIRSNFKYNVAVSVHKAEGKSTIKVGITGPSYNETKEVELLPMSTTNVEFDVPTLSSGDYNLTADGTEGVIFKNTTKLNYADNKPSIFIQTDKATYKPSDLVRYRVLFLDENTRPAAIDKPITIAISDGEQNRIKQLTDIQLTKGVFTGELQLSEQPVLGTWSIAVNVADDTAASKSFEVAKYVLPKFEVVVESAKDVAIQDGVVKATIRAKYTYGKPVKGKATVSLEEDFNYYRPINSESKRMKTVDIDGKAHVEFPIEKSAYGSGYTPPLKIFAEVTEDLTGNKQNASSTVTVHSQRYKIEAVNAVTNYHPGKTFAYQFVVKNLDGSPVQGGSKKAKLVLEAPHRYFNFDRSDDTPDLKSIEWDAPLNEHGIATFDVVLPVNDTRFYNVKGVYDESSSYLGSIHKFQPTIESAEPLQIIVSTKTPKLGKDVSFDVKSNEQIPYFVYAIIARGNIVKAEHVDVPKGRKTHTIKFTPTFAMVPQASIYVFFIFDNELRFEERTVDFEKDFDNSIEISAPLEAKPSEDVELKIKTDADSYVGLLGVDQSVLLLKSGNDLARDAVFDSLDKYKTSTPWQSGYGRYPGQTSGLVTLTNANYPYNFVNNLKKLDSGIIPIMKVSGERQSTNKIRKTTTQKPNLTDEETYGSQKIFGVREIFMETWIFDGNLTKIDDADGFTLVRKIPDTITSWVITGFSLNPRTGIALTKKPRKIRVFQPFFVSTNLPYSVKRGEVIAVPVIIFNYMDKDLDAEVTMDNSDKEFEFTEATNEVEEKSIDDIKRVKRITVPSNNGQSISFMIRPNRVGSITLKITATTPLAGDTIHQKLKVEPEGVTQFENVAVFVNLMNQSELSQELNANIPTEAVRDSEFIEFSVVGDLLGPTIKNLDNLVRKPYGCGEQNMVNFVPNILVVKYLEVTNRNMPSVVAKAKKFLEIGYQRELTYKHDDGSYSAFGKSDKSGSTWLTAYVVRSFHQAANYTDVDPAIIMQGLNFLVSTQKENGEFPEVGKLFDNANQNALGLTSFVLIAFFENKEFTDKSEYQQAIHKGLQFVAQEVDKTDDQYSLSIAAVALQLAKHPQAKKVLDKLQGLAKLEDGRKWWSKSAEKPTTETSGFRTWRPSSNDVEITSYVLMALLEEAPAEDTLPIIKWLIAQRNSNGGFSSTQDTVIGLQALTKFAFKAGSGTGTIDIDFVSSNGDNNGTINVNPENSLVLQSHILPKSTRKINFTAKGQGSAMVQLSYRYNLAEKDKKPSFKVTPTVKDTPMQQLTLEVCAEYVPLEASDQKKDSNMAVMEIALPSGFISDSDSFGKIQEVDRVKRIETKNSDSTVIIYFDSLTPGDVKCLPVEGVRAHSVAKQKPAAVSLYDYYDTDRRATEYYEVKSSLCDICEGSDCGAGCKKDK